METVVFIVIAIIVLILVKFNMDKSSETGKILARGGLESMYPNFHAFMNALHGSDKFELMLKTPKKNDYRLKTIVHDTNIGYFHVTLCHTFNGWIETKFITQYGRTINGHIKKISGGIGERDIEGYDVLISNMLDDIFNLPEFIKYKSTLKIAPKVIEKDNDEVKLSDFELSEYQKEILDITDGPKIFNFAIVLMRRHHDNVKPLTRGSGLEILIFVLYEFLIHYHYYNPKNYSVVQAEIFDLLEKEFNEMDIKKSTSEIENLVNKKFKFYHDEMTKFSNSEGNYLLAGFYYSFYIQPLNISVNEEVVNKWSNSEGSYDIFAIMEFTLHFGNLRKEITNIFNVFIKSEEANVGEVTSKQIQEPKVQAVEEVEGAVLAERKKYGLDKTVNVDELEAHILAKLKAEAVVPTEGAVLAEKKKYGLDKLTNVEALKAEILADLRKA